MLTHVLSLAISLPGAPHLASEMWEEPPPDPGFHILFPPCFPPPRPVK
jgi:hypothetical protein